MAQGHEQKHPYHLVDPSPWPLMGGIAGFIMAIGMVMFMQGITSIVLIVGFLAVLATMYVWWKDVVRESVLQKLHTPVVAIGLRYGMILFIASEVMFFVAFFWAFFDASLFPKEGTVIPGIEWETAFPPDVEGVWPPKGIFVFDPFDIPLINTMILLLSGCTVTFAHHALLHGDRQGLVRFLAITVALGLCFTSLQAYEYIVAPFSFSENIYTSTFFMATGFHGFHVIVGTIFLAVCLFRAMNGHFTPDKHVGFEAAAWYWHFVDVVWLFLFACVYWWGAGFAEYAHH